MRCQDNLSHKHTTHTRTHIYIHTYIHTWLKEEICNDLNSEKLEGAFTKVVHRMERNSAKYCCNIVSYDNNGVESTVGGSSNEEMISDTFSHTLIFSNIVDN